MAEDNFEHATSEASTADMTRDHDTNTMTNYNSAPNSSVKKNKAKELSDAKKKQTKKSSNMVHIEVIMLDDESFTCEIDVSFLNFIFSRFFLIEFLNFPEKFHRRRCSPSCL